MDRQAAAAVSSRGKAARRRQSRPRPPLAPARTPPGHDGPFHVLLYTQPEALLAGVKFLSLDAPAGLHADKGRVRGFS